MKNVYKIILFLLLSNYVPNVGFAQRIEVPNSFRQILKQAGISFIVPVESGYKDFEPHLNQYKQYDFGLQSKKEKLEIRYAITPYDEKDVMRMNPHLLTMQAVASIASNEDDYIITAIEMAEHDAKHDFNADWGMIYFFIPKDAFSMKPHCRMIALHKEEKGTAFVFYLFKNTDNEALDKRYFALEFQDDL